MSRVIMPVADGFEEIEAVTVIDILRRAGLVCDLCSVTGSEFVTGSHSITIRADMCIGELSECSVGAYEAVVLPGGMPGSDRLRDNEVVIDIVKRFNEGGKIVAAICAAPKILERAGILNNKKVTFYPDSIENEKILNYTNESIECDGNIITGKAPGVAAQFAFELVKRLKNEETAGKVKGSMYY